MPYLSRPSNCSATRPWTRVSACLLNSWSMRDMKSFENLRTRLSRHKGPQATAVLLSVLLGLRVELEALDERFWVIDFFGRRLQRRKGRLQLVQGRDLLDQSVSVQDALKGRTSTWPSSASVHE